MTEEHWAVRRGRELLGRWGAVTAEHRTRRGWDTSTVGPVAHTMPEPPTPAPSDAEPPSANEAPANPPPDKSSWLPAGWSDAPRSSPQPQRDPSEWIPVPTAPAGETSAALNAPTRIESPDRDANAEPESPRQEPQGPAKSSRRRLVTLALAAILALVVAGAVILLVSGSTNKPAHHHPAKHGHRHKHVTHHPRAHKSP